MTLDESRRIWRMKNKAWLLRYARVSSKNKGKVTYRCKQCNIAFKSGVTARMHSRLLNHSLKIE